MRDRKNNIINFWVMVAAYIAAATYLMYYGSK